MGKRILITGGAGFIGSHLVDELVAAGHEVRVLDNLAPSVHGPDRRRPAYFDQTVELIVRDVRDERAVRIALQRIDVVYHLAPAPATALLSAVTSQAVERLIVASSMSVYGEGLYKTADGRAVSGHDRSRDQLRRGHWELHDHVSEPWEPIPTPESKGPAPASVHALSIFDQERLCLLMARACGLPVVVLRFFNVYGPRQHAGVLTTFASRLIKGHAPVVFEDGYQRRDFVNVADAVGAARLALDSAPDSPPVYNVGSGRCYSICEMALRLADILGRSDLVPQFTGEYRIGDIRHCFADISRARAALGYRPGVDLESGLDELAAWVAGQQAVNSVA